VHTCTRASGPLHGHRHIDQQDGARLVLERAFSAGPGQPWAGALALFSGRIGTVEGGRHARCLQVRSDTELLDALVPRHVYQPGCLNTVYDDTCGVQRQAHRSTGTATGGTDASRTSFSHNQAVPVDHWTLGDITMTSGANAGIARTVWRNVRSRLNEEPLQGRAVQFWSLEAAPRCPVMGRAIGGLRLVGSVSTPSLARRFTVHGPPRVRGESEQGNRTSAIAD
jgi:hypothetical protein